MIKINITNNFCNPMIKGSYKSACTPTQKELLQKDEKNKSSVLKELLIRNEFKKERIEFFISPNNQKLYFEFKYYSDSILEVNKEMDNFLKKWKIIACEGRILDEQTKLKALKSM